MFLTWRDLKIRRLLLVSLGPYVLVRVWSGLFFIPEMLAFQQVPLGSSASQELAARVASWPYWTWFREPLDVFSYLCPLLALVALQRSAASARNQADPANLDPNGPHQPSHGHQSAETTATAA